MLFTRVITASILAPLIIWAILKLPNNYFALLWGGVILLCGWEWSNLAGLKSIFARLLFLAVIAVSALPFWYWTDIIANIAQYFESRAFLKYSTVIDWFAMPAVVFWLMACVALKQQEQRLLKSRPSIGLKLFIGWFVLIIAWAFLDRLRHYHGAEFVLFLFFLVWLADISAYFIGRAYGKAKLSPHISPGKTMAGMNAALAVAIIAAVVQGLYYDFKIGIIIDFVLLSLITVLISIYGDLGVSLAKRWRGVKDSGNLLPGHGGLLDRLDSLLAAIPVFFTGLVLIYEGIIK